MALIICRINAKHPILALDLLLVVTIGRTTWTQVDDISKFAMLGLSKVLREELKEVGVRVTAVLPGATRTASWDGVDLPDERFMKVEDVAETIFAAHALSKRSVVEEILIRPQLGDIWIEKWIFWKFLFWC